jgi:hypothetical protein
MKPVIPNFLYNFKLIGYKNVEISNLYVGLLSNKHSLDYVNIEKTPHHKLAKSYIFNSLNKDELKKEYINYLKIQSTSHAIGKFENLINDIKNNGYNFEESPILVWRHWSRPLPLNRLDVADGFHRLAILSALGYSKINVAVIKRKENFLKRIANKLKRQIDDSKRNN